MASRTLSKLWTPRPNWRPANRGDTKFTSERRLWRLQMTEMRRNLQHEDLLARRAAYVAKREADQEAQLSRIKAAADPLEKVRRQELLERVAAERAEAEREAEASREHGRQRMATRRAAEEKDRLAWLHALQKEYDVTGADTPKFSLSARKRSFLTPEARSPPPHDSRGRAAAAAAVATPRATPLPAPWQNLDTKLTRLLMGVKSPVEDWTNRARDTQATEERLQKNAILGGSLPGDRLSDVLREPSSAARPPLRTEVTEAERQADLDAGLAAPIDTNDAEFIDRLRNIMGNLTPDDSKPGPAAGGSDGTGADDGPTRK